MTGITHFYYVCDFTDISCKHNSVLSITLELSDRDVFIVLSKDYRLVHPLIYNNRSYSLYEKKFVTGLSL